MILIKGGRVIDPVNDVDGMFDIILEDRVIKAVGHYEDDGSFERVIDASDKIVSPGFVDVHVHFRDPGFTYKEDILTGAAAAAKGGYTTVICMANTKPPIDSPEIVKYVLEKGRQTGIHVETCATVSKGMLGQELVDMDALKEAGAIGFTDDGKPLMNVKLVKEAMENAARLDVPLSFHEEDPAFISNNGINHGTVSEQLGLYGSPALAEDTMVARDCMIALHTGAKVDIQHISSKNSVKAVAIAKELGANVKAEATPHHFSLDETAVLAHGTLAKMNPPLRTADDRMAIIRGLQDGTIDMIATDHAPHSTQEKAKPLTEAPSGIIGLETAMALAITNLVHPGYLTMNQLIEKMSVNPAAFYKLPAGHIGAGDAADLVIFDEREEWEVKKEDLASKAENTPFIGCRLQGKVKYTICEGKIAYEDR